MTHRAVALTALAPLVRGPYRAGVARRPLFAAVLVVLGCVAALGSGGALESFLSVGGSGQRGGHPPPLRSAASPRIEEAAARPPPASAVALIGCAWSIAIGASRRFSLSRGCKPSLRGQSRQRGRTGLAASVRGKGELASIIEELEEAAAARPPLPEEEYTWFDWLKEKFGWVLVADIFAILAFLLWYLVGIAFYYLAKYTLILDVFIGYWDPYIQGVLGVCFAGRVFGVMIQTVSEMATKPGYAEQKGSSGLRRQ